MMKFSFSFLLLFFVVFASAQDRILKNDGTVIKGKVISFQNNRLVVLQEDETEIALPRKAISEIKFDYQEEVRENPRVVAKSVEQPVQVSSPAPVRVPTAYSNAPEKVKQEPTVQPTMVVKNTIPMSNSVALESPGEIIGLEGRVLMSSVALKEKPIGAGRVAVAVCLNTEGGVLSAKFKAVGSSTIDADLISLAVQNAREFKFSKGNSGDCGVIVYKFNMQ
jgi:RNase P/RNase MRP subunit p29